MQRFLARFVCIWFGCSCLACVMLFCLQGFNAWGFKLDLDLMKALGVVTVGGIAPLATVVYKAFFK